MECLSRIIHHFARLIGLTTWRSRRIINAYTRSHSTLKILFGAGTNQRAGWLNTDRQPSVAGSAMLDITQPMPFRNVSVDYLYGEHVVEHVTYIEGLRFLKECRRVLKPGGVLRIATPDLNRIIALAHPDLSTIELTYIKMATSLLGGATDVVRPSFAINAMFSLWGHRFIYDRNTLEDALREAGFDEIRFCRVGESKDRELVAMECHGALVGNDFNLLETMVLEAQYSQARR